jgi:hypothetical protein
MCNTIWIAKIPDKLAGKPFRERFKLMIGGFDAWPVEGSRPAAHRFTKHVLL